MSSPISPASGSNHAQTPFLAFVTQANDIAALKTFANAQGYGDSGVLEGNITQATEYLSNHSSPALLMVEIPSAEEAPGLLDKLADVCDPHTKVVITGKVNEYSFYCWLMEIGIFSYLLQPLSENALNGMVEKLNAKVESSKADEKKPGRTIGVMGARGGVGATTISIMLASQLAKRSNKNIALADLNPQDGSISLFLDLQPSRGLREALEKPDRIDSLFLDRVLVKAGQGLHIISTEDALNDSVHYHEQASEVLLGTLREKFDLTVLDLPRYLNHFTRQCMRGCEQIYVVTEPTLQGLRDAIRLQELIRDQMKLPEPIFIVNRVGMASKYEINMTDFEKSLRAKVTPHRISFTPEVFMQSGPAMLEVKPTHAAVKAIGEISTVLFPETAETNTEEKKPRGGFFKKK